jgi:hypothetical protein
MRKLFLMLARFSLSAWVGAAALFVVNGVQQVMEPEFDSTVKDRLALLRFPTYYVFGFVLVGLSLLCLVSLWRSELMARRRQALAMLLVAGSLGVMAYDYAQVYSPMARMITPPGQAKPAEFHTLHQRSEMVNSVHVGLCLAAALFVCWPRKDKGGVS